MEQEHKKVINIVKDYATHFLENADEFYPFGIAFGFGNQRKSIDIFWGKEMPSSNEVLEKLEDVITVNISNKLYLSAVVGIDVYITVAGEKRTALEIRIYDSNNNITKYHVLYSKQGGKYSFND
ncbi:hypothetical protein ACI6Q2_10595 [Chitinophagaceae bacterium LWZ2-11]